MNLLQRTRLALGAMRKSLGDSGGGPPYGSVLGPLASVFGWGSHMSDAAMETYARGATTTATCVGIIASRMAEPDLVIEEKLGKRKWGRLDEDDTRYGKVAQVFQQCNANEGRTALWMKFYGSLATFGRAPLLTDYVNFNQPVQRGRSFPRELSYLYAPNFVPQFTDYSDAPTTYRYSNPQGGKQMILRPDEVLHHVNPRLDDPWAGASLVARAAVWAVLQRKMGEFHIGYFQNGTRTGVVLESDQKIGADQMARLEADFKAKYGNIEGKAFKTWFLHSGFKIKDLGDGQKDGDFPNLFRLSRDEIGGSFHIPPVFLNDFENATLANIEEQTPLLYEGALMPLGKPATENLTEIVGPRFDPLGRLRFRLDWDNVPAVMRVTLKKYVSLSSAAGAPIITRNEGRKLVNLEPLPDGDGLLVPFSMTDRGVGAVPDALAPESGAAPKPKPESGAAALPPGGKSFTLAKWIDSAERKAKRVRDGQSMTRFVSPAEGLVRSFLTGQETRVLAKLPAAIKAGAVRTKDDSGDFFDDEFEGQLTANLIMRIYQNVASVRGPEATEQVGAKGDEFLLSDPAVQAWMRKNGYANGKLVTGTTADALRELLAEGVAAGLTESEITSQVSALYDLRRSESLRIARTEVTRSYNFTAQAAWKQTGVVESQEWLTAEDDHVRGNDPKDEFDHTKADGLVADLDGTFDVSGEALAYPGDPAGSAGNTINCRCTILPVLKSEAERAFRISRELAAMFSQKKD